MAGNIDPTDAPAIFAALGISTGEEQAPTAPLFEFSPFSANNQRVVLGFADPLGTGIDPGLKVFNGRVQFMDLLGDFIVEEPDQTAEIELPRGTMRATDLLSSFVSRYLATNRAYDQSLLNIRDVKVTKQNGLPITTETSPLSLAGYGSVAENLQPYFLHWTVCPGREKRKESMLKSIDNRRGACIVPGVCVCSSI